MDSVLPLSRVLRQATPEILNEWETQVRATVRVSSDLDTSKLRDSIPLLLETLCGTLEMIALGIEPAEEPKIEAARAHGS